MKVRRDQANIPSPVTLAYVRNRLEDAAGPVSTYLSNSGPKRWEVGRTHSRYNYIVNPSFENNVVWWSAQQGSLEHVTGFSHSGNACAKYTKDAVGSTGIVWTSSGSASVLQAFTGKTYTFSIWLYHENATDKSFNVTTYERYRVGGNVGTPVTATYTVPPHVWTRVHVTKTMIEDAETSYSLVYPQGFAEGESFFLDDAQFEEGSEPTDYFDGSHENAVWATFPSGVEGTPHSSASIINPAPVHEDVTTNYLMNPSAEVNASFTNAVGSGVVVTRDTSHALFGIASFKVVCDGTSTAIQGMYQHTAVGTSATGTTWSASAWIKAPLGFAMRMLIREDSVGSYGYQFFTGTGTWQWVTMTYTTVDPGNSYVHLRIDNSNGSSINTPYTMYVDGMQMEKSAFASSFTDGSLGSDYAWTGTPYASTSTRAARALSVPLEDHIDYDEGAVMYWYKPKEKSTTTQILFNAGVSTQRQLYATYWAPSNTFRLTSTNASASSNAISGAVDPNTYHFVYADWDSATIRQSVDGGAFVSNVRTDGSGATVNYSLNLWLGTSGGGTSSSNGDLSEIIFLDRRLELEEIQRIYESSSASLLQPDMFDYAPPVLSRDRYQPQVSRIPRPKKQVSRQVQPVSMIQRTKSTLKSPTLLADLADGDTAFSAPDGIAAFSTSGPVRYQPSPFSRVNYVRNPRCAGTVGAAPSQWVRNSGNETWTIESDETFGTCVKVTTANSVGNGIFTGYNGGLVSVSNLNIPPVYGRTFTASVFVRSETEDRPLQLMLSGRLINGNTSETMASTLGVATTDGWTRLEATGTVTSVDTQTVSFFVLNAGSSGVGDDTFYVTGAQLEEGNQATEFFDGTSPNAIWWNASTGYVGTPNASQSLTNAAHWIEPAVTNLVTNPSFEVSTSGWAANGTGTITRDTTVSRFGAASLKVITSDAPTAGAKTSIMTVTPLTTYVVSFWAKGDSTMLGDLRLNGTVYQLTADWTRYQYTYTTIANQTTVTWYIGTHTGQVTTFWIDGVQIEQRNYASAYCDGSLGFGHSWNGTPGLSSSSRATALLYTDGTRINPEKGSVAALVKFNALTENRHIFFDGQVAAGKSCYQFYYNTLQSQMWFSYRDDQGGSVSATVAYTIEPDTWYFVYAEWDQGYVTIQVNDTVGVTAGPGSATGDFSNTTLYIGNYISTDRAAGVLGPVYFFDRPLTMEERELLATTNTGALPFAQPSSIIRTQGD